MYNPFDFTEKKYIVTGSTSGIGRSLAGLLAVQGAEIHLIGRNEEKLAEVLKELSGEGHRCSVADLGTETDYTRIFDEVVSDGKKADGIVYCAAVADVEPLRSITDARLYDSMKLNLFSFIGMVRAFSKKKYHSENSAIVGISSTSAIYPDKGNAIYSATKAAMNAAVQALARELCDKGIRINTIMPACVDTRMLQEADEECRQMGLEAVHNRQLLGVSKPEEIAQVIMFLLSDASGVITGRAIFADGGDLNF